MISIVPPVVPEPCEGLDEAVDTMELPRNDGAAGDPVDEVGADVLGDRGHVAPVARVDRCEVRHGVGMELGHEAPPDMRFAGIHRDGTSP